MKPVISLGSSPLNLFDSIHLYKYVQSHFEIPVFLTNCPNLLMPELYLSMNCFAPISMIRVDVLESSLTLLHRNHLLLMTQETIQLHKLKTAP